MQSVSCFRDSAIAGTGVDVNLVVAEHQSSEFRVQSVQSLKFKVPSAKLEGWGMGLVCIPSAGTGRRSCRRRWFAEEQNLTFFIYFSCVCSSCCLEIHLPSSILVFWMSACAGIGLSAS